jgi:hypothetical protein
VRKTKIIAVHFVPSSGIFWVNAHCRRLSARAPPGTVAARGYMAADDGGPRWTGTEHIEVTKFTRTCPSLECRRISPALEHSVLKGKTWLSISGCPADQRRPHRLQRRVCRLRRTKRTWRAMAAAAQTAAATEATAPSLDSYSVDRRCRRLEARNTRRRAASRRLCTASSRAEGSDGFLGPKARKHDNTFGRLTVGQNDGKGL